MLQFVDSFYCASNSNKGTVVLRLSQEEPVENKESGNVDIQVNEVSNVILDHECARQLALSILQLLDSPENSDSTTSD